MTEDIVTEAYSNVIEYIRKNHPKEIDEAYEFFWEEEDPIDMMGGPALELAFINFEDWLICDYSPTDGTGFIDRYIESEKPSDEVRAVLTSLKESCLSLYEVTKGGKPIGLSDIAVGDDDFEVEDEQLSHLEAGYSFAARFIDVEGTRRIGRSVYPFGVKMKNEMMRLINAQLVRYQKNKNPEGTMKDFLRDESYAFNMTWMSCLYRPKN